jgi:hypothetical protein
MARTKSPEWAFHLENDRAKPANGIRGRAARPVQHADVHHATEIQAQQLEVSRLGGFRKPSEHLHGGLQFRIGHQWQIDQAPIQGLPDLLVFELDLLPGRVRRQVSAKQAHARQRIVDGLGVTPCEGSRHSTHA